MSVIVFLSKTHFLKLGEIVSISTKHFFVHHSRFAKGKKLSPIPIFAQKWKWSWWRHSHRNVKTNAKAIAVSVRCSCCVKNDLEINVAELLLIPFKPLMLLLLMLLLLLRWLLMPLTLSLSVTVLLLPSFSRCIARFSPEMKKVILVKWNLCCNHSSIQRSLKLNESHFCCVLKPVILSKSTRTITRLYEKSYEEIILIIWKKEHR